ncbi:hypothetical protein AMECASPLE_005821 [Ameca splendens]|uniref:Uncharacterized protein n=1 Tax=Ameca splendens TaxID=208324 RepID=A0ABV0ZL35_9TELE
MIKCNKPSDGSTASSAIFTSLALFSFNPLSSDFSLLHSFTDTAHLFQLETFPPTKAVPVVNKILNWFLRNTAKVPVGYAVYKEHCQIVVKRSVKSRTYKYLPVVLKQLTVFTNIATNRSCMPSFKQDL